MSSNPKNTPTRTVRKAKSSKKENPNLNLLLKQLDQKIDQRFDALDRRIDTVDQKVDAFRQETAAEFKAVRGEMTQGLDAVRGEMAHGLDAARGEMTQGLASVRGEIAQGSDLLRQEFKSELQKQFKEQGDKIYPLYTSLENKIDALDEKYGPMITQLHTGMDPMARNYQQFVRDRVVIDAEHQDLKRDVETLKKRDMEKAAAIEKIEKEIEQLKAA